MEQKQTITSSPPPAEANQVLKQSSTHFFKRQRVTIFLLLVVGSMLLAFYLVQPDGAKLKSEIDIGGNTVISLPDNENAFMGGGIEEVSTQTGALFPNEKSNTAGGLYGSANEYDVEHEKFLEELENPANMNMANPTVPEEAEKTKSGPALIIPLLIAVGIGVVGKYIPRMGKRK